MLGSTALYACSPHFEGTLLHAAAHQFDGFSLSDAKLAEDGIKRSAVFPGHFDDAVDVFWRKFLYFLHAS